MKTAARACYHHSPSSPSISSAILTMLGRKVSLAAAAAIATAATLLPANGVVGSSDSYGPFFNAAVEPFGIGGIMMGANAQTVICSNGGTVAGGTTNLAAGDSTVNSCSLDGAVTFQSNEAGTTGGLSVTDSTASGSLTAAISSSRPFFLTLSRILFAKEGRIVLVGSPAQGSVITISENTMDLSATIAGSGNVLAAINLDNLSSFIWSQMFITKNTIRIQASVSQTQSCGVFTTETQFENSLTMISENNFQHSTTNAGGNNFAAYFNLKRNPLSNTIRFEQNRVTYSGPIAGASNKPIGLYNVQTDQGQQQQADGTRQCLTQVNGNYFVGIDQPIYIDTNGGGTDVAFEKNECTQVAQHVNLFIQYSNTALVPFSCYVNSNLVESTSNSVQLTMNVDTVEDGSFIQVADNNFKIQALSRPLFNCGGQWILEPNVNALINNNVISSSTAASGSVKFAVFSGTAQRPTTNFGSIYVCGNAYGADKLSEDWMLNMMVEKTMPIRFKPMSTCGSAPVNPTTATTMPPLYTAPAGEEETTAVNGSQSSTAAFTTEQQQSSQKPTTIATAPATTTSTTEGPSTTRITLAETQISFESSTSSRNAAYFVVVGPLLMMIVTAIVC